MVVRTCEKAKRPMRIGMKDTPPMRYMLVPVKRMAPLMGSMPIVAMKRPMRPPIMPLMTEPEDTLVIMLTPKIANAKYSGFENCSATFASCGAKMSRQTAEKMPPNMLPVVEMPAHGPAAYIS